MSIGKQGNQTLFCRLTPELSRPVAGRRTRASVAHSTWLTPRHGVGLNDLLGGTEPRDAQLRTSGPRTEAWPLERASRTFSRPCQKQRVRRGKPSDYDCCFRSRPTQRMRTVSAHNRLDRRGNVAKNRPKSKADRSRQVAALTMQLLNAFYRLTPELSRLTAGQRTRASVAYARGRCHDVGSA
jgi:hypothetical protein